jgi:hypothetical protein
MLASPFPAMSVPLRRACDGRGGYHANTARSVADRRLFRRPELHCHSGLDARLGELLGDLFG